MSHILKKIAIAGAGGGSRKPKPPVYKPPVLGELQYGASHSYAETLDLVSDGPIEGLVDPDGRPLDGVNILQGIYLDGTPVAVTNRQVTTSNIPTELEEGAAEANNMQLDSTAGTSIRHCQRFFEELALADQRSADAKVSSLIINGVDQAAGFMGETIMWPSVSMFVRRNRADSTGSKWRREIPWFIRAWIQNRADTPLTFHWWKDESLRTGFSETWQGYYNSELFDENIESLYWTDEDTLEASKFLMNFSAVTFKGRGTHRNVRGFSMLEQIFPKGGTKTRDFISTELNLIADLVAENDGPTGNPLQKRLAERALQALDWNGGGVEALVDFLHPDPAATEGVRWTTHEGMSGRTSNVRLMEDWEMQAEGIDLKGEAHAIVVVKVNETGSSTLVNTIAAGGDAVGNIILRNMNTMAYGTEYGWSLHARLEAAGVEIFDVSCPTIDPAGILTGDMHGCVIYKIPLEIEDITTTQQFGPPSARVPKWLNQTFAIPRGVIVLLKDIESFKYAKTFNTSTFLNQQTRSGLKFNYTNVLAEVRKGGEFQPPFNYFRTVFIDHPYGRELFGPFNFDRSAEGSPNLAGLQKNAPQRIAPNTKMLTRSEVLGLGATNFNLKIDEATELPIEEGSDDFRATESEAGGANFSDWAGKSFGDWNESAVPVVHTVYNPNVTRAFITLNINQLTDTLVKNVGSIDALQGQQENSQDVGTKFPAVLNIRVETGSMGLDEQGNEGLQKPYMTYNYRIVALIDGTTLIDIGNPDYKRDSEREFVVSLDEQDSELNAGFALPPVVTNKQVLMDALGERGIEAGAIDQDSTVKRYIRVTKLSFETNSVLISKLIQLNKVTEIIDVPLPYPFSAIIGTKLDSRSFSSIPRRTYDCKLKQVKVPSNYYPVRDDGADKRYYNNSTEFNRTTKKDKLVYRGDWDGRFKARLEWTDNPAWILYDLLTNYRYGMGAHLDVSDINKWQLYKIGRFCDAVDDDGYFEGVTDGRGGTEPRFSSNIVFDKGQKIFDAITTIAALFRGRVFFGNSEINFVDDRPRTPVNLFTNDSVKDGLFFYSNNRRDEQFNCIEVGFRDRFDNFVPKIEVVEDEESIKEKGIFKKKIEGVGITSRAMARRVAQHQIFSKIKENQQIAFTAGLETLLCQPGDLVFIEDDLKTNLQNYGKVLAVDPSAETIRVSNTFLDADMTGVLTIMNPTGKDSSLEITTGFVDLNRRRYYEVAVTGDASDSWVRYTGVYGFSGYTPGYAEASGTEAGDYIACGCSDPRYQEYALYTGLPESGTMLYFQTEVTGWVFASGTGEENRGAFDLASGDFISESTGDQTLATMGTGKITVLDMNASDGSKRSADPADLVAFSGFDPESLYAQDIIGKGVLLSELDGINPTQLQVLKITGNIFSTQEELTGAGFNNYGSVLSGFDKPEALPFVKLGSNAKVEIKNASPFIYKINSMKEENPNEYLVTASKYETGKFKLIEEDISIEYGADTFSYQQCQTINNIQYCTLDAPRLDSVTTGEPNLVDETFTISGMWNQVSDSTGYNMTLTYPNGAVQSQSVGPATVTGGQFSDLRQVGVFNFCVNALGNKGGAGGNAFFDSQRDCSGIFVVYDEMLIWSKSFINQITIG